MLPSLMKSQRFFSFLINCLVFTIYGVSFNCNHTSSWFIISCHFDVGKTHAIWTLFFYSMSDSFS